MVGEFKGIDEQNGLSFWSEERVISEKTLKSLDMEIQL